MNDDDVQFVGSIPDLYQRYLGPALFQPYADDLVGRLASRPLSRVLEIAAGTGIVTRALRRIIPQEVEIVATDLNAAMLATAQSFAPLKNVRWSVADAAAIPFEEAAFNAVVCQFGLMFFPDKPACAREIRRVLAPGGTFAVNVWDEVANNPIGLAVIETCHTVFPQDPPRFYERGPYSFHDGAAVEKLLHGAGFDRIQVATVDARCQSTAGDLARGLTEGNPLYNEIVERDPAGIEGFRAKLADTLRARFGDAPLSAPMRAHVFLAS